MFEWDKGRGGGGGGGYNTTTGSGLCLTLQCYRQLAHVSLCSPVIAGPSDSDRTSFEPATTLPLPTTRRASDFR